MKYQDVYNKGLNLLKKGNIDNFIFENNIIFEHVFKINKTQIYFYKNCISNESKRKLYFKFIDYRIEGLPLQYIVGVWSFYNLDFAVGNGVLIPRQDTETLIDEVLNISFSKPPVVYDLCAGTGCIGITIEKNINTREVILIEKSKDAFYYLMINKNLHKSKSTILNEDIFIYVDKIKSDSIDIVVSNPPYIDFEDYFKISKEVKCEPIMALIAEDSGTFFYYNIADKYYDKIKYGGYLVFEIGYNQADEVVDILSSLSYKEINVIKDITGNDRVVKCRK